MLRLRSRRLAAVLLLAALHMLVFDRGLGGDGWASFAALESLADDGDLHLEDNLRGVRNGIVPTPGGHLVMQYPPGILLLDLPPFLAGRAADALVPARWLARGADLPPVGRVPRRIFLEAAAIVLARNLATLLGLFWLALALRRLGFAAGTVAAAVALTFFGGPLLFYSLVGMTHAPSFALASLLFLLLIRHWERVGDQVVDSRLSPPGGSLPPGRGRVGSGGRLGGGRLGLAFAAGAVLGLTTLVRYGAVGLLPAALLALGSGSGRSRLPRLLAFAAGFVIPLLLLPLYWHTGSGVWGPPGYGGVWRMTFGSPWNVLFSPHHGLFLFHPALLLAALGLGWAAWAALRQRAPGIGTIALLGFLGIAVLHGWWSEWANPGGYGQRFLTDALPALGLGFAQILAAPPRWAWKATLAAAALFGYILFFTAIAGLVPPPPPDPWPQRLADYRPLLTAPPGAAEIWAGLKRASLPLRAVFGGL